MTDVLQPVGPEPESIEFAVKEREAIKVQSVQLQGQLKSMTRSDRRRPDIVREIRSDAARSAYLSEWVRRENGAISGGRSSGDVIQTLLDIFDRLEDDGVAFTDKERATMDDADTYMAWTREQAEIRRSLNKGTLK